MLFPAFTKTAAEASAMNAINRVYSIRSWPCSSFTKRINMFVISVCPPLSCWLCDLAIACDCFRDRAITDTPLVTGNERTWQARTACNAAAKNDGNSVVVHHAPVARDL